jgi:L-asparaginase
MEVVGDDRLDLAWYSDSRESATSAAILARVPELARIADVELIDYPQQASTAITSRDWLSLLAVVDAVLERGDIAGLVVAHGTNTLEETAYFLHLTLRSEKPVVLTGSMRPFSALSWDAEINLVDAVTVASASAARGLGTLVVLNSCVHSARDVTKASTYGVDAFESRGVGPLGAVDPDRRVRLLRIPAGQHTTTADLDPRGLSALPRVDAVISCVDSDEVAIDALAAQASGLVFAGTGAGRGSPAEEDALVRAQRAGVAVCIASRVGSGRVGRSPRLARLGQIAANDLLPWKARILLSLALTSSTDPDELQSVFDRY